MMIACYLMHSGQILTLTEQLSCYHLLATSCLSQQFYSSFLFAESVLSRSVEVSKKKQLVHCSGLHRDALPTDKSGVGQSAIYLANTSRKSTLSCSTILYSGALPPQALRIFKTLNHYTISLRMFFWHQKQHLQPAVSTIWESQQLLILLLTKVSNYWNSRKRNLWFLMMADLISHVMVPNMAHTLIMCNKVVNYRLIQVAYAQ